MASCSTAVVVGGSEEELAHVQMLPFQSGVRRHAAERRTNGCFFDPPAAKLMIVYARKQQKDTLGICEQLRSSPGNSAVPILLVIGRYEISQGNAVERSGNAMLIITPFDEDKLRQKTTEWLKSCW